MDVNANLSELTTLAASLAVTIETGVSDPSPDDVARMAELVIALDEWITRGGFLPTRWQTVTPPAGPTVAELMAVIDGDPWRTTIDPMWSGVAQRDPRHNRDS